jgi:beta-lactamase regulating signal transducer with metallopeptidase domain
MTASFVAYVLLTGALVTLATYAADAICRLSARSRRWTWLTGLIVTVAVAGAALAFPRAPSLASVAGTDLSATPAIGVAHVSATTHIGFFGAMRGGVAAAIDRTRSATERVVSLGVAPWSAAAWLVLTGSLLLFLCVVHRRFLRLRRQWPIANVHDVRVKVAPASGPAVMGVRRPDIVIPRWLLARADEEQRLVVEHEGEHVRARDPMTLAIGWGCAVLMPWHPATWWMLSRLRLAVELDCDQRVLRRGASRRSYGALLVDLSARFSGLPAGATALADRTTHLEQRLIAMNTHRPSLVSLRAGAFALAGLVAIVSACEMKMPTASTVEQMDGSAAERAARQMELVAKGDSAPVYYVDGVVTTRDAGTAILPGEIASIEVRRGTVSGGTRSKILITTNGWVADGRAASDFAKAQGADRAVAGPLWIRLPDTTGAYERLPQVLTRSAWRHASGTTGVADDSVRVLDRVGESSLKEVPGTVAPGAGGRGRPGVSTNARSRLPAPSSVPDDAQPIYVVDGVIMQNSTLNIDPLDIASIQVIKAEAALQMIRPTASQEIKNHAKNGIINIKTNRNSGRASGG